MIILPYILFGSICVTFGMSVYYFLPLGLLTTNAPLILEIFFFILVGMIMGLTLFAVNMRGFFERILIYVLFFWEKKSMRTLIKTNLIAHKKTNKLTSVIYALTLGCIIFIIEAANLQILEIDALGAIPGVDIIGFSLNTRNETYPYECISMCIEPNATDPILFKYKDHIKSFAYQSVKITNSEFNDTLNSYN